MWDDCLSGIFIFTADEKFLREVEAEPGRTEEVWRPSRERRVRNRRRSSILYENRIVIFKETDVEFPSDFSHLGYIEFEKDQLAVEVGLPLQAAARGAGHLGGQSKGLSQKRPGPCTTSSPAKFPGTSKKREQISRSWGQRRHLRERLQRHRQHGRFRREESGLPSR